MITISRSILRQFRALVRKAGIHKTSSALASPLVLVARDDGLKILAQSHDVSLCRELPGSFANEQFVLPLQFLDDCAGRKDVPVTIENQPDGRIAAQWREGGIPQLVQYDAWTKDVPEWPAMPEDLAANELGLLAAIAAASETTDAESSRYALGCIQFQGSSGSLIATDGRQLLVQRGYEFPWQEDVLAPGSNIFACADLPRDEPVCVGKTDKHVAIIVGPWQMWLRIEAEARFPQTADLVRLPATALNRCRLSPADAAFLMQSLPHLPSSDESHYPVTVDLNGHVAVRGKGWDQEQPTEIVLTGSEQEGEPRRFNINRDNLARAIRLGLHELCFFGDVKPVQACDERRAYVWMALDKQGAIPPSPEAVRIESQPVGAAAATPESKPRKRPRMKNNSTPAATETDRKPRISKETVTPEAVAADSDAAPIEHAKQLRSTLREMLSQTNQLIASLRRQQKHSKAVASTLASLKQLERISA